MGTVCWASFTDDRGFPEEGPAEPLSVGADPGETVAEYLAPLGWHGLLEDVRLYWGFLDRNENREALADWADLPGCGCRK